MEKGDRIKILHVGPLKGGVDVHFRNILSHISDKYDLVVVNGVYERAKPYIRNGQEIDVHTIVADRDLNPFKDFWSLLQVIWIILKEKPDIVHCHSAKGGVIGRTAAFLTGTKAVYTPHAFSFFAAQSKIGQRIFCWIERITKFNSWLIGCSNAERDLGIQKVGYPSKKSFSWCNSIPEIHADEVTLPKDVSSEEKYIVTIARPSYQKNTTMMVDIMSQVHLLHPEIKFYLLGADDNVYAPLMDDMRQRVKKYHLENVVTILPWLSHDLALGYLKHAQLYLTTSLYEGLPIAVLEAMALCKAIVASDVIGNRECVTDGYNGLLLSMNVDDFSEAICRLVENKEKLRLMGEHSRVCFEENFLIEKRIHELENIYQTIYLAS